MKGNSNVEEKKCVHCAIMGDEKVGKTSISGSYEKQTNSNEIHEQQMNSSEEYESTVFDNYVVSHNLAGEGFIISMFDVSAKKNFESLRSFAFNESEVLLLCFSTADRQTFTNIKNVWLPELKRHSKSSKHSKRPVILVGTQIDLRVHGGPGEVSADEGVQLAKEIGAESYVECSARDQKGLKEVFHHVVTSGLKFKKKKMSLFKKVFRRRSSPFVN